MSYLWRPQSGSESAVGLSAPPPVARIPSQLWSEATCPGPNRKLSSSSGGSNKSTVRSFSLWPSDRSCKSAASPWKKYDCLLFAAGSYVRRLITSLSSVCSVMFSLASLKDGKQAGTGGPAQTWSTDTVQRGSVHVYCWKTTSGVKILYSETKNFSVYVWVCVYWSIWDLLLTGSGRSVSGPLERFLALK